MKAKFINEIQGFEKTKSEEEFKDKLFDENPEWEKIAASLLNNGFFTIAWNWTSDSVDDWVDLFIKLGANDYFINKLADMFEFKSDYESSSDDDSGFSNSAWEEMIYVSKILDKELEKQKLDKKLIKRYG